MKTDIGRLHDVFLAKTYGRGCGKSLAICHQIAGIIELGTGMDSKDVVILISSHKRLHGLRNMLFEVLEEHNITAGSTEFDFHADDLELNFYFVVPSPNHNWWYGFNHETVVVDARDNVHPGLSNNIHLVEEVFYESDYQ